MKLKTKIKLFTIRITTAFRILFVYKHWFIAVIDRENLGKLVSEQDTDINIVHHRLLPYNVDCIVRQIVNSKSDVDMMCAKAEFHGEVEHRAKEKLK